MYSNWSFKPFSLSTVHQSYGLILLVYHYLHAHAMLSYRRQIPGCRVFDVTPLPVVLDSTIESGFICKTVKVLYTFSCSIHTSDLVLQWSASGCLFFLLIKLVLYSADHFQTQRQPTTSQYYSHKKTLVGEYGLPLTTSTLILIVQPFNESENEVILFSISCQSHCIDENNTAVCKTKYFNVAGMIS